MSESIAQILKMKGSDVCCIAPDATVYEALKVMAGKGIGALVVVEDGQVVGLFNERDYVLKVDLCGRTSQNTKVLQVMTTDVCYVTPQTSVEEAMAIVTNSRSRHLPVLEDGNLVGLTSIGDLVKSSLKKKDFVIKQLEKYIKGIP
jgi:CBS domain-containing protein